jgi:hypothetical protein
MCELAVGDTVLTRSEHLEQVIFVAWFRKTHQGVIIFAIPNGGGRSITQGVALKSEGVLAGIPDLFIPEWRLWIEMKRAKGGRVSNEQKEFKIYLEKVGYEVIICKGAEDAMCKIQTFLNKKDSK